MGTELPGAGENEAPVALRYGFVPTLVERAPRFPTEGYIIDFWGAGYDVVEKMGLLPEIVGVGYRVREVRLVDRHGDRVGGFNAEVFRKATGGRYTSLARGDLSAILYRAVERRARCSSGIQWWRSKPGARMERAFCGGIASVQWPPRGAGCRPEGRFAGFPDEE